MNKKLVEKYIKLKIESIYRGFETPEIPDFDQESTWKDYFNDALAIGKSKIDARNYADMELARDKDLIQGKRRLYTPKK